MSATKISEPGISPRPEWSGTVYLGLLWLWLVSSCWQEWRGGADYSYGWLVIPLAGYFAFKRLENLPLRPRSSRLAQWGLFLPAVAALPLELLRLAPLYWRGTPWAIFLVVAVATLCFACLTGGTGRARALIFPLVFASLAIPWPTFFEQAISLRLMAVIADVVGEFLRFCGIPAQRQGMIITLPNCAVGIEEACSGLRSLQASIMVALAAGELARLGRFRRLILLFVAPYLALVTNLGRTIWLAFAGLRQGAEGIARWHNPSGIIAMLAMALLVAALAWLIRPRKHSPGFPVGQEAPAAPVSPPRRSVLAALILIAASLAAAHGWYALHAGSRGADSPLLTIADPEVGDIASLPGALQMLSILAPDEGRYLSKQDADFGPLTGYHFFWKSSRQTINQVYHRPDVCMPGAGWTPLSEPMEFTVDMEGKPIRWYLLQYERDGLRADLLWGAWLDGKPVRFALGRSLSVQAQLLWQLIRSGRRDATYEVAAVLVPQRGGPLALSQAQAILQRTFLLRENPSHR